MKKKLVSWVLSSAMALNFAATMPINAFAASGDSRVYEKDGYTVTYSVGSEWDNNQTIEVTIQNTGEESILNWALKYDIDGALSNVWNSKVFCSSEEYTVIKNTGYNYEIEPGQAVKYGYILTSDTDAPAELPEDIELFNRRIDVKSGYETDFNITSDWYTGFQAEISITNTSDEPIEAWTLSFNGNFNINNIWNAKLISSENRNYVTANQLWTTPINPGESTSFGFTADKSATENAAAENFALTAVVIGESSLENAPEEDEPEDIDYELDTDEDGLPDYYEEILGTDKNNADTDSDGLNDGYEVFYLGTNPTKADSDDNCIPDGSEDPDNDGLTNIKECELGTDPNNADTDGDGLSDGAEVYTYGTDPLKYDTDDDGISDGDEITLGLDPNNGSTNGTPDSEKSFTQIVSSDSEVLSAINEDEETPFKVSLEMKAAGVAENNIFARESGYSNAIENSAIIGVAPEFVYTDGLAVEEVTVKFELDNSIVSNTLGTYAAENDGFKDIKRLMVFMFFDDVNMLLPVETNYDEVNNVVYTTTDRLGTYCLIDMELFFSNLGIEPSESKIDEEIVTTPVDLLNTEEIADYNSISLNKVELYSNNATNNLIANNHFDVAFIIGEVCYNDVQLEGIKKEVCTISEEIFNNSDDVTISIYGLDGSENTQSTWYGRTDNIDGVKTMLNHVEYKDIKNKYNIVVLSDCIDYVTAAHKSNETLANRDEFCFVYFDPESKTPTGNAMFNYCGVSPRTSDYGLKILELIKKEGTSINFSTITNSYETVEKATNSYANLLFNETSGINVNAISLENVVTESLEHIYGEIPENVNVYKAIIATGYSSVVLDSPLSQQDMDNAEKLIGTLDENNNIVKSNYEFSEEELEDCADSDNDGLWDFEEVMFYLCGNPVISFDDDDNIILPTVANVLGEDKNGAGAHFSAFDFAPYVENGLEKAKEQYDDCYFEFLQYPILPIKSDPTNVDGDEDGLSDTHDKYPLSHSFVPQTFKTFITEDFVSYNDIVWLADNCYICTVPLSELITKDGVKKYINSIDTLSENDLDFLKKCISSDITSECYLSATIVGEHEIYYVSVFDNSFENDIQNMVLANNVIDSHIAAYTNTSKLGNNIIYKIFKGYTNLLTFKINCFSTITESTVDIIFDLIDKIGALYTLGIGLQATVFENDITKMCLHTAKGFVKAPFKMITGLKSLPVSVLTTTQSYIEYTSYYKSVNLNSNIFEITDAFLSHTSNELMCCMLDDFDTRIIRGDVESRGEYIGEVLFDVALSIATVGATTYADEIADLKVKTPSSAYYRYMDTYDGVWKTKRQYITSGDKMTTIVLKSENFDIFNQICSSLDDPEKFIELIGKHTDIADDIIDYLFDEKKVMYNIIKTHLDDFVTNTNKYTINFVKVFSTYPQHADDIIRIVNTYGDSGIAALSNEITPEAIIKLEKYGITPDFYNKNYNVTSMDKVEKIINKNKHIHLNFSDEEIHKLINAVLDKETQLRINFNPSNGKFSPAVSGVLYKTPDGKLEFFFGTNSNAGIIPDNLPKKLIERITNMPDYIENSYVNSAGKGSHAEIYAISEAMNAYPNADIDDFLIYVNASKYSSDTKFDPFCTCPHCEYILSDFNIISNVERIEY